MRTRAYIELLRPANVATALADVLAGFAFAQIDSLPLLPWLLLATACLYAGGVVLNDVFDRDLDRIERPERPIPSGRASVSVAAWMGGALLAAGVASAAMATWAAALVASAIALLVLFYDTVGKRHSAVAPVNMGLCRALNLLLGMAAVPPVVLDRWPLALIPFAYIAGVTALSRGEVRGGHRGIARVALISLFIALAGLAFVALGSDHAPVATLVLALLAWRVVPPFLHAARTLDPARIREAVKSGVLSLVLLNAVIGTAFAGPAYGAIIVATALAAGWLARLFPVT